MGLILHFKKRNKDIHLDTLHPQPSNSHLACYTNTETLFLGSDGRQDVSTFLE